MTDRAHQVTEGRHLEEIRDGGGWDAEQRVAELEQQLEEQLERERILELEVHSLRRDVDVKVAYAAAMEKSADERQRYLEWLQLHFDEERRRADSLAEELAAERARISHRVVQRILSLVKTRRR